MRSGEQLTSIPQSLHEAVGFIYGIGQTIPHLTSNARNKLRGQIVGGLKTNGLRPLQHEFRVATRLSNVGYEITFSDLEDLATFDLLAELRGQEFEKSVPVFSGRPILPARAERFFNEVRRGFEGWADITKIPLIDVLLKFGLPSTREELLTLLEACILSARAMGDQIVSANCLVRYVGAVPGAPYQQLAVAAKEDWIKMAL
jgi:hypothetical protein